MFAPRVCVRTAVRLAIRLLARLLYNGCLKWHLVHGHLEDVLSFRKATAENTIYSYNFWRNTSNLSDAAILQRIVVWCRQQELRLYGILQERIVCLE